jgi:maleylacetoacetate isomerase
MKLWPKVQFGKEEDAEVKLFAFWRSSCSYRVRIALNLKEIEYEIIPINTEKGEHKSQSFTEINPAQFVPAL